MRQVARGEASEKPASRKGILGWTWALLVTFSFLWGVWRSHLTKRGVVIYDRHVLDALVTFDFVYEGGGLGLQRALIRRFMPRPNFSFYLDLTADEALARKTGQVFGEHAVRRQLDLYARRREEFDLQRLDATRAPEDLAWIVLESLTTGLS